MPIMKQKLLLNSFIVKLKKGEFKMKKTTAAILIISVILSTLCFGAVYADGSDPFAGKDTVNIAYIGGSITEGWGVNSDSESWVSRVSEYFNNKYPDKTINHYNEGIGGTDSLFGFYRLEQDVIRKNPDLVFVEYAVNDGYRTRPDDSAENTNKKKAEIIRDMEGIVRALSSMPNSPYIIFIYTTQDYRYMYDDNSETHQLVADHYGIPSIDMQPLVEKHIADGGTIADWLNNDGNINFYDKTGALVQNKTTYVHPNANGYKAYADEIIRCLETGDYYKKAKTDVSWMSENKRDTIMRSAKLLPEMFIGDWQEGPTGALIGKKESDVRGFLGHKAGNSFSYDFYGTAIGLETRQYNEGGSVKIEIDGKEIASRASSYGSSSTGNPRLALTVENLDKGFHNIKCTIISDTKTKFWLDRLFVNDGEQSYNSGIVVKHRLLNSSGTEISTPAADEMNRVELIIKNETQNSLNDKALLCIYSGDMLKGVSSMSLAIEPNETVTMGIGTVIESGDRIKLLQWDSYETLKPLYDTVIY